MLWGGGGRGLGLIRVRGGEKREERGERRNHS